MKNVAVLISGRGSNLLSILKFAERTKQYQVCCVITDNYEAPGLRYANERNIPVVILPYEKISSRIAWERNITLWLESYKIELVVLAGFMKVLHEEFCNTWEGRCINIHPSLLPKYPGLHTHRRVLEAGDKEHGCTVYFVSPYLNSGIIIAQEKIEIVTGDTEKELSHKITECEKKLYPLVIQAICQERIVRKTNLIYFDGKLLTRPLSLKDF